MQMWSKHIHRRKHTIATLVLRLICFYMTVRMSTLNQIIINKNDPIEQLYVTKLHTIAIHTATNQIRYFVPKSDLPRSTPFPQPMSAFSHFSPPISLPSLSLLMVSYVFRFKSVAYLLLLVLLVSIFEVTRRIDLGYC